MLETAPLQQNEYVTVTDTDKVHRFVARSGQHRHFYTNIPVDAVPHVSFNLDHKFHQLAAGGSVYLTQKQGALNKGLARDRNVTYRISVEGKPNHAIVTFPHYKGVGGWETPYGILDGRKFELENTLVISFQEPYFSMGSYFLSDNYGGDPVPTAVQVIKRSLAKYGLSDHSATFIGSSKGANIAALVSQHFDRNQLILCAYSTDVEYRVRNTDYSHLAVALDRFKIPFPEALEILKSEGYRKETHWFYSIGDDLANRGQEHTTAPQLTTYACTESHSDVILGQWSTIRDLISLRIEQNEQEA